MAKFGVKMEPGGPPQIDVPEEEMEMEGMEEEGEDQEMEARCPHCGEPIKVEIGK